ncbi:Uncharacterized protein dnm_063700 [Desulfonema magnum]|uniref:Uncharacterized protein n=1 Tax=Desulfonema magnum TaxID=45655 RepID=A0A975BSB6_9BACT|nr:Uncharacterized protein dnm_063700 [Desulfonema magnum]
MHCYYFFLNNVNRLLFDNLSPPFTLWKSSNSGSPVMFI